MSHLFETKEILQIKQKAFVLLLIKRRTFLGHPVQNLNDNYFLQSGSVINVTQNKKILSYLQEFDSPLP